MHLTLAGPVGSLEARLDTPDNTTGSAVLCHPHPLYGGSMYDGVLDCAAERLLAASYQVLRFNFRGVGASDGEHDQGAGEVDDLLAACAWVDAEHGDLALVGGYSFGANVTWRALPRLAIPRALLIAPPSAAMSFTGGLPDAAVHAVYGDQDSYVDIDKIDPAVTRHPIAGADHFFSGCAADLAAAVDTAIA